MRKIVAITQLTLDGVMQGPGGPEEDPRNGFTQGGWAMPFGDEAVTKALNDIMASDFDLLLGRRTYDIFAGYWPHQGDNPITNAFNKAVKHVVTHRSEGLEWKTSKQIIGDVADEVQKLKATKGPDLHIWGTQQVLQTLMAAGLVEEHRLWVAPVVLGTGTRLFEAGGPPRALELVETTRSPSGVMFNTYRAAGPIPVAA